MECHVCNSSNITPYCRKNNHNLYKCGNCGFVFVYPTPGNLDKVYEKNYFHRTRDQDPGYVDYDKDKKSMRHVFEKYLKKISKLTKGRNILDIGCATGYFLDMAREYGWKTYGAEISEYAGKVAKERGHEVFIGPFPQVEDRDKMDVVTMWDVLEHVDNPKNYLKAVNKSLKKEGFLIINTPDVGSFWARLSGGRWGLIVPPEHLSFFNKRSLRLILEQTGFKVIEIKRVWKWFSLPYFFNMGYRWQGLKIWKFLASFSDRPLWRKISLPINFRDNILVLAKKISNV